MRLQIRCTAAPAPEMMLYISEAGGGNRRALSEERHVRQTLHTRMLRAFMPNAERFQYRKRVNIFKDTSVSSLLVMQCDLMQCDLSL